jgi:hypothetical protein
MSHYYYCYFIFVETYHLNTGFTMLNLPDVTSDRVVAMFVNLNI